MPFVERDGAQIHWRAVGQGEPVVLIMGLGCSAEMWHRLVPALARRRRVILLDNRGSGLTRVAHFVVHRVSAMAADVAAVLDAAGETSAHLVGFSMGGMIAQQFVIDFPARVRSLALLATSCGGAQAVWAAPQVRALLFAKGHMTPEASLRAMRPYTYARSTPAARIEQDHALRLAHFPTLRGYQAQLYALLGWSAYARLARIACPTLVLHGREDALIPPVNGRLLAERIAGARWVELDDASHWLATDQRQRVLQALQGFLDDHPARA